MPLPWLFLMTLAFMAVVINIAWAFQRQVGNSGWIDVFWTFGTGLAGVAAALWPLADAPWPSQRQVLVAGLAAVWSLRLGLYVAVRVARSGEDARYAAFRRDWGKDYQRRILLAIQPQAVVTAMLCVAIAIAAHAPDAALGPRDLIGAAILVVAILGEAVADRQLSRFKATHKEKGAICEEGLWAWSRHPNYLFEWFGWLAYPVIGLDPSRPVTWLTLLAPAVMYAVLRYVTGVPPLEKTMLASRGERFRAYQARTSIFFLLPPKQGASA